MPRREAESAENCLLGNAAERRRGAVRCFRSAHPLDPQRPPSRVRCRAFGRVQEATPMRTHFLSTTLLVAASIALTACTNYVRRDDFDATIHELRSTDAHLQAQIDAIRSDLTIRFEGYDARFSQLEGRLRIDMTAHFAFDDARIREQDRPALDDFAAVMRDYHPHVLITVEGFADPAGSPAYNKRLAQRRADNVREYLVGNGLAAQNVRAVSYGEDANRQVVPGAWGDRGEPNRRVALVIDYVGRG
jgi:peptidoglycan-associated lipoprotein